MTTSAVVVALTLLGLALWLPAIWRHRRVFVAASLLMQIIAAALLLIGHTGIWSITFVLVSSYSGWNLSRIARGRMQADHMRWATRRSAWFIVIVQLMLVVLATRAVAWPVYGLYVLSILQLLVLLALVISTTRSLQKTKTLQATKRYADKSLPSISVLIPARNETEDLQAALQSLVASDYPKLEILVLDDCSQNKHTPEIIKSFAHDGVRFIAGQDPGTSWLAKNYAYQQLAEAASGEYVVFCGADLTMSPGALRELITTMLEKDKTMLSVLPQNAWPHGPMTALIQPMRYAWELSPPRRLFNRPPVLSTCWVIKRDSLLSAGGFKAVSRTITPESYFARFASRYDGYSFLRSILLVSNKPVSDQQHTAVRTRYPQLHRRPELVAAVSLLELTALVLPLPLAVYSLAVRQWPTFGLASAAFLLSYVLYLQVTGVMYGRSIIAGLFSAPIAAAYDIYLLHISMYRYEFREIIWKGRNICLPVMRLDELAQSSTSSPGRES